MLELIQNNDIHTRRDPVKTRERLLWAAFNQVHRHGFQATSLEEILRDTEVTKGALYHHFPNKKALGLAVIDEVIAPTLAGFWIEPILNAADPITVLQQTIESAGQSMTLEDLKLGCPLNNLAQEMSSTDDDFRQSLEVIYEYWRNAYSEALDYGKQHKSVAAHIDSHVVAASLVASLEGCIGMSKNAQDLDVLRDCGRGLLDYLETLRA